MALSPRLTLTPAPSGFVPRSKATVPQRHGYLTMMAGLSANAAVQEQVPGVLYLGMAILGEARGQGGGRALIQAIVEHAHASRAHKLELEVWLDNARAIAFYASPGFEVEGLRRAHYRRRDGSLRSALLMARLLPDISH